MIWFARSLTTVRKLKFWVQFLAIIIFGGLALPAFAVEGDAEAGKTKAATCMACHGTDGNSIVAMWPSIAGQHASYLQASLIAFKDGTRNDPVMSAQAIALTEQDIADLAAYYAEQNGTRRTANKDLVSAGERLYRGGNQETATSACIACHGPKGRGNAPAGYPSLTGQHAIYTEKQLSDYKNDQRKTDGDARIMRTIAEHLTNKEIKEVAAYIQGLR